MWLLQSLFIYLCPSFLILVNRGFWRIIICISDARGIKRHSAVNERPEGRRQEPSHPREDDPERSQSPLRRLPRALRPEQAEPGAFTSERGWPWAVTEPAAETPTGTQARAGWACEVRQGGARRTGPGDPQSSANIWSTRPVGVRKNTTSTVFPSRLPRVWRVSAIISNQHRGGEEAQKSDKSVEPSYGRGLKGGRQSKVKKERSRVCRSTSSSARWQEGTMERRVKGKSMGLEEGQRDHDHAEHFRELHFKGNESSCWARAVMEAISIIWIQRK